MKSYADRLARPLALSAVCAALSSACVADKSDSLGQVGTETDGTSSNATEDTSAGSATSTTTTAGTGNATQGGECPPNSVGLEPPGCPSGGIPAITEEGCYLVCDGPDAPCEVGVCTQVEYNPCPCPDPEGECCEACAGATFVCLETGPDSCEGTGSGPAFGITPFQGEQGSGTSTCTITETTPLTLMCSGAAQGEIAITINNGAGPFFAQGQDVIVDYVFEPEIEWGNEWLRIRDAETMQLLYAATQSDTFAPSSSTVAEWYSPVGVEPLDRGCAQIDCNDGSGLMARPMGMRFFVEGNELELEPGAGGMLSGGGAATFYPDVREAREGACGITLGDQDAWWSFSIITEPAN